MFGGKSCSGERQKHGNLGVIEEWGFWSLFSGFLESGGFVMTLWSANDRVESENTETRLKKKRERRSYEPQQAPKSERGFDAGDSLTQCTTGLSQWQTVYCSLKVLKRQ